MGEGIWVPPGGSADPRRGEEPEPPQTPPELTPEELVEQIKRLKVSDVLLSTLPTLAQLGYAKLERSTRDLEQARLAIEGLRALLPVLEGVVPEEVTRDFRQVVSNLQLAYASAAAEAPTEAPGETPSGERAPGEAPAGES